MPVEPITEPAAALPTTLAEHLGNVIDRLASFRNKVDLPKREDLLSALRRAQQEAAAKGILLPLGATVEVRAQALAGLTSAAGLLDAIGVREMPGTDPYEAADPHWAESLLNYFDTAALIESGKRPVAFPSHVKLDRNPVKNLVSIRGDTKPIKIAIVGDWGTGASKGGSSPATVIAGLIKAQRPDYTIHLGDVYYAGLVQEESDSFLKHWPAENTAGTYSLNSNHEMYCGGKGYFEVLLADRMFAQAQQGLSYFGLTNDQWLILGLDTAFFGFRQSLLYEQGVLSDSREADGMVQVDWITDVLKENAGKRVIILTHHDGFDVDPFSGKLSTKPLYSQMTQELANVRDWFWYWGHVHTAIVYAQMPLGNGSNFSARCVGHGGIPYSPFPKDYSRFGDRSVRVKWAETRLANNGGNAKRAPNGYMLLTLNGLDIKEEFYDELGNQCWSNV